MSIPDEFKYIYKYTSLESAKLIISSQSIKFNNANSFNDPFDCNISQIYFDISMMDETVRKEVEKLTTEFPHLISMPEILNKGYKKSVEAKIKNCGIACFSLLENHQLMWAHYADQYKGVCLGFNNKIENFESIKIDVLGDIDYNIRDTFNFCSDKIEGIKRIFMTKSADWKYEKEFRMITLKGPGIYNYKPGFLKSITFGLRVLDIEIEFVIFYCKKNGIDVSFFKSEQRGLEIKYVKINA